MGAVFVKKYQRHLGVVEFHPISEKLHVEVFAVVCHQSVGVGVVQVADGISYEILFVLDRWVGAVEQLVVGGLGVLAAIVNTNTYRDYFALSRVPVCRLDIECRYAVKSGICNFVLHDQFNNRLLLKASDGN